MQALIYWNLEQNKSIMVKNLTKYLEKKSHWRVSIPRPADYKSAALPG